jgi:hypothetical protein
MARLEALRRSADGFALDAASFMTFLTARLYVFLRGKRKQAHNLLKGFRTADISVWCPRGDTTLLALVLQALDGQMPARGEVLDKPTEARFVAVLKSIRSHDEAASIGSCSRLVSGILGDRSLLLLPARAEGALGKMLSKIHGAAANFPCYRVLPEVLLQLPALVAALAGRRSSPDELIKSVVDLLTAYGRADSQESMMPANLQFLEGNSAAIASAGGSPAELYARGTQSRHGHLRRPLGGQPPEV